MIYFCDICRQTITTDKFWHKQLDNIRNNSLDICLACHEAGRKVSVFRTVLEANLSRFKCDFCKQLIIDHCSAVNATLFICAACLDVGASIEQVNERVNELLASDLTEFSR
jgi:hypothetical protein